jgi:hypothetical protein
MNEPEVKISSFTDTKEIEEDGIIKTVPVFIPDCCRLGLPSCKHSPKRQRIFKNNIGM